nr:hypothetical protein [Tanacetum cinerariifolium]
MTGYKGNCGGSYVAEHGTWVFVFKLDTCKTKKRTYVDQNTPLDHNVGGSTSCVSAGQVLTNDVTKGPALSVNAKGHVSFAKLVTSEPSRKYAHFCNLIWPADNGVDVAVSLELKSHGVNMTIFKDVMDEMLENDSWFIHNTSPVPKKWTSDVNLLKEDVDNVPVWVKLHNVPIMAFSEDGLSAITTKLGTPLMLDSYTSAMCIKSCGRSSFARAMIELRADVELKDTIMVFVPKLVDVLMNVTNPRQAVRGVKVEETSVEDDDYDPYDDYDDVNEGHDMSENLQAICDHCNIKEGLGDVKVYGSAWERRVNSKGVWAGKSVRVGWGRGEGVVLEEKGDEFGLDLKDEDVVPKLKDVPLVDGVLEGAFGDEGDEDFAMGEGV